MHPQLHLEMVRLQAADLARRAERRRVLGGPRGPHSRLAGLLRALLRAVRVLGDDLAPADPPVADVRIRHGMGPDLPALGRLAATGGAHGLEPPVLVAEVDGQVRAALSLWNGHCVADGSQPTDALVQLLGLRAAQLAAAARRPAARSTRRPGSRLLRNPHA